VLGTRVRLGALAVTSTLAAAPRLDMAAAEKVGEEILKAINEHDYQKEGVHLRPASPSASPRIPECADGAERLFQCADEALYRAKRGGKCRVSRLVPRVLPVPAVRVHPSATSSPAPCSGGDGGMAGRPRDARRHRGPALRAGQGCFVASGVRIGDGCRIQNHVSLYGGVELATTCSSDRPPPSQCPPPPRALPEEAAFEATRIARGASIGANATIVCGVSIGRERVRRRGAVVTRDVPDHALVIGTPARIRGWVCACGETVSRAKARPPAGDLCQVRPRPQSGQNRGPNRRRQGRAEVVISRPSW